MAKISNTIAFVFTALKKFVILLKMSSKQEAKNDQNR